MEWISVKTNLPDFEERVLATDGRITHIASLFEDQIDGSYWSHYEGTCWKQVTHWMPIPDPPPLQAQ